MIFFQSHLKSRFSGALCAVLLAFASNTLADTVDFTLLDVEGKTHSLSDYRGQWVVVNYWATWCPPCLREIPELVNFHEDNQGKGIVVLGIDFENVDHDVLKEFVEDYFISYPVLIEKPAAVSVMGDIPGLPTTFIVSPQGEILARQVGSVTAALLSDFIERQKKESASNLRTFQ